LRQIFHDHSRHKHRERPPHRETPP
jgi:hypothetical protein